MQNNFSFLVSKNASYHDISRVPIFGTYKNVEDQLTVALLHIIKVGGEELLQEIVATAGGQLNTSSMQVATQVPFVSDGTDKDERGCRCDGFIYHECGYRLYLESKITCNSINVQQLNSYRNISADCAQKIIFYVTPDESRPEELSRDELWINWEDLLELLCDYVKDEADDSILKVYVQNICLLYDMSVRNKIGSRRQKKVKIDREAEMMKLALQHIKKPDYSLVSDADEDVLIVGGSWGEPIALKYGFYSCQYGRTFLPTKYLAFYHNNRIKYLFRIEEGPRDIETLESAGIDPQYFEKEKPNYHDFAPEDKRNKFFRLQLVHIFNEEIKNDKMSKSGKRTAYIQNQCYTTIGKMLNAKVTSEL